MGFDLQAIRFFFRARAMGVSFQRTATLGRQCFNLSPESLRKAFAEVGSPLPEEEISRLFTGHGGSADGFLQRLDGGQVESFDASGYEQATHAHDFNQPIPPAFHERYSTMIDGGSLEHVFNLPVAIANCMQMVEPGGHFISLTPTNNFSGHGFYQFSPELFFRVLSAENGFAVKLMVTYEHSFAPAWREVLDPAKTGQRGTLSNWRETMLMVLAQRTEVRPLFTRPPMQSDYQHTWDASEQPAGRPVVQPNWKDRLPPTVRQLLKVMFQRYNPVGFRKVDWSSK